MDSFLASTVYHVMCYLLFYASIHSIRKKLQLLFIQTVFRDKIILQKLIDNLERETRLY